MKKITALLITILSVFSVYGQDISGRWSGILKLGPTQLRVVFNIAKTENGFSSTMDSPDQGTKGIPVTTTTFENLTLRLVVSNLKIEYTGMLRDSTLTGVFKQGGGEFPLDLLKGVEKQVRRPQEPAKPYSYYSEDITFRNPKAGISLAGTLTLPKKEGKFPVVILISGSGPQNRDEELFGHKPFLVIADHLTKSGVAVLRYDDRGVSKSQGVFNEASIADFATDAESAVAYLKTRKEIDSKKIGLIGHSEGGIIASQVAAQSSDPSFIVLLAAPGIPGHELMLLQKEKIERQMGIPEQAIRQSQEIFKGAYRIILNTKDTDLTLEESLNNHFKTEFGSQVPESQLNSITKQLVSPGLLSLLKYDPAPVLIKIKCPVFALNGERDLQVSAKENLFGIRNALTKGGNKNVTIKEYPGLNHLFQSCKTCLTTEYAELEETISPLVLDEVTRWIREYIK